MNQEHLDRIRDYLIFQKLPLDILLEVEDHMASQVLNIQKSENISFDEAFLKTQKLWESEFKMTTYSAFYSEKIPVIVKKIVKARYNKILKKSFFYALISLAINLLLIYFSNSQEMYTDFFRGQNLVFLLAPGLVWAFNYKIRKYVKKDFKYKGRSFYSIYQQNIGIMVVGTTTMAQIVAKEGKYAYLLFKTNNPESLLFALVTLFLPFIAQMVVIFGILNFFEHKKTLKKLSEFA
ncbi:MAG: hypothetical protein DI622_02930 [Chryseobacterium sp.]|uniref:hypothetical protein n=1 Tax=Chryseobacterium sp. TaxID=1871047 RepID=UPI000DB1E4E2|nr:hypothetical protein [Chryseobacterium sp.]MPS66483.1 hypothetical protein [Chryseobacterium sp.]PZU25320.1 MAG: hypothetical protein DI622_02930 [Chryseobacterium sp.]